MPRLFMISCYTFFVMVSCLGTALAENHRILLIASEKGEPYQSVIQAMQDRLSALGHGEGIRSYSLDHFKGRAKNILRREEGNTHDLICVFGTVATIALKELIFDDPKYPKVVFSAVTDPVGIGVINDFTSFPEHNFTGVSYPVPVEKRMAFVKALMPNARNIGLIYADMPQSQSYNKWLSDLIKTDPRYRDYTIFFRQVPFVKSAGGTIRMTKEAVRHIRELDTMVDLFLSPNDQLAVHAEFPGAVFELATKPLLGLGKAEVMEGWGATAAYYPSLEGMGQQTADMVIRLLDGADLKSVIPEEIKTFGMAFDMEKIRRFGIHVPEKMIRRAGSNILND